jgi:hypothetical protein
MMIKYHNASQDAKFAEFLPGSEIINTAEEILDIMVNAGYNGCTGIILHSDNLNQDFFDLKTGLAGEILQKFSNYRMRLSIIGDFSDVRSKSLRDFIRESNIRGTISFTSSLDEAISKLDNKSKLS